ncbi:translation machinery-associated protein 16 [Syncephalastrum racemosum]|uniref:Translation machinery-associated protein 16 n=1 Tax=Syncephalastrum racemosum TaxID=13706 RepID=A0A1X2HGT7_SYNRA|nr:translation machinery-associated protein 16 [Syncephalastrum racemosum]
MPGNKKLTLKNIKNRDAAHPYSRKAKQLNRAIQRKEKLTTARAARHSSNPRVERWLWFRFALDENLPCASEEHVHELIRMYIDRTDDELEELEKKASKAMHRQKSPKIEVLKSLKHSEENEYESGMELPILTDADVVKILRAWDGDANSLARIKTTLYRKSQASSGDTAAKPDMDTTA